MPQLLEAGMAMLSIKRVVLYKHGVGHFEREGVVNGDAVVPLQFKQREVSDVLKSLTVLDLDGGLISTVSYDSTTPVEQLLADIAITIPDEGSLTALAAAQGRARLDPPGRRDGDDTGRWIGWRACNRHAARYRPPRRR